MAIQSSPSLAKQVFNGTKWYVAMRWSIKGMGFVSSAFLARLLVPEDFGLVATAMAIFGLVSLLFEFGVNWALIQNSEATDQHFDTAWTIRLLQSAVVSVLLMLTSPYIAQFYQDPRIELIIQIVAVAALIGGFKNIGTVKFQKELQFSKDFYLNVLPKIFSTLITIGLAFYYKSYMALVVGTLISIIINVAASYLMSGFRPKLSLAKFSEIWGFSQWILVRNFAQYISTTGDILILSSITSVTNLGYYRWASELSLLTNTEIQQPFARALIPALVKLKQDKKRLIAAYIKALSAMTLLAIPIALGFGAVSQELIPLFLGGGDKWLPVVPLIECLVFFSVCTSMYTISGNLLTITGNVKYTAYLFWIQAIIIIATMFPAFELFGLLGIVYTRVLIGIIMFFVVHYLVKKRCGVTFSQIINIVWRPLLAGLAMYAIIINLAQILNLDDGLLLVVKILLGAICYVSFILGLWLLCNKPPSLESEIIQALKAFFQVKIAKFK
ncbi:MAG: lipopolysaccharide biosynthesis protein [Gammaproteobacteria bacterium]|nr:lipopolysaccharide biosynthesis protein [Gammaproteobacteria bacterium]